MKGSSQVDGNTEFQFKAGDLNLKSKLHESGALVISGKKITYREGGFFTQAFNLEGLDQGLYSVQLKAGNMVMTKRLNKK